MPRTSPEPAPNGLAADADLYRLAFESVAGVAVCVVAADGRVAIWNRGAELVFGYVAAEIIGQPWSRLFLQEDRDDGVPERELELALRSGTFAGERWGRYRDGTRRWLKFEVNTLRDATGAFRGFSYVVEDATPQRRFDSSPKGAESSVAALEESERRLRTMIDRWPSIIFAKDTEGRYLLANQACRAYSNLDPEQMVGKTDFDLLPREYAEQYRQDDLRIMRSGETERYEEVAPIAGVPTSFLTIKFPLRDAAGVVYGICGIATDITDLKRAEDSVRRLNVQLAARVRELEAIFEAAPVGISVTQDPDCKVILSNRAGSELLGVPNSSNVSKTQEGPESPTFRVLQDGRELPPGELPMQRVVREGTTLDRARYDIVRSDGTTVPVLINARPVRDDTGKIAGGVEIIIDLTEQQLAEERFRAFMNHSPATAWITDTEGTLLYASDSYSKTYHLPEGGIVGRSIFELFPNEVAGSYVASIQAAADAQEPVRSIEQGTRADGSEGSFLVYRFPIADAGGRKLVGGVAIDITERLGAEEAVSRNEQRFRALVTATVDTVYRISADWSEVHYVHDRDAQAEQTLPSYLWFEKYVHPDDQRQVLDHINRVIRTRGVLELEHRVLRADGMPGWAFSRIVPIKDARGEIIEWFGTSSDITWQKRAEGEKERLKAESDRQRRMYEAALSNTPDLVYVFGLDHRFLYANEALLRMWGRSRGEALGKTCLELGYERWHAEMHDREIEQVIATRQPLLGEVPFTGSNGRRIYEYIFVPVIGQRGDVVAVAGTTRDVTERQQAEQAIREQAKQLRENDRRKDEFLAMLAHELRNPLAAISNAVKVTGKGTNREDIDWTMDVVSRQTKHLARLIDDLLDVSRISRDKIELRRGVVDLTTVIDSAINTARGLIDERHHTLEVAIDRGELWADVDPTRMEQVVVNLLNNAAKYSQNEGHIRLVARNAGESVVIAIRDRGVGIPPERLDQMFELFTQGDRSLARSEGGLGIGLTVVKKLVEMHGGNVTATSEGPGKGSEFTILLPCADRPAATALEPAVRSPDEQRKPARVLVVDDNPDTTRGMARLLSIVGHDVRVAHSGPEAILAARETRPEFILLDIGLPGMDGYEVATRLRSEECGKDAVMIAVSGYGQDADRRRSKEAGFDHHLIKPLDHDALFLLLSAGMRGDQRAAE